MPRDRPMTQSPDSAPRNGPGSDAVSASPEDVERGYRCLIYIVGLDPCD